MFILVENIDGLKKVSEINNVKEGSDDWYYYKFRGVFFERWLENLLPDIHASEKMRWCNINHDCEFKNNHCESLPNDYDSDDMWAVD